MNDTLIFFSQEKTNLSDQYHDFFGIHIFHDYAEWKNEKILPSAIIITGKDLNYIAATLGQIRRDENLFESLCFITESVSVFNSNLIDGQLPQPLQLQERVHHFLELDSVYKNSETYTSDLGRLIKYL